MRPRHYAPKMSSVPPVDESDPTAPGPEHFESEPDQLVVALPQLGWVRHRLEQWGIPVTGVTASSPLGLALVTVAPSNTLVGDVQSRLQGLNKARNPDDYVGQVLAAVKRSPDDVSEAAVSPLDSTIGRNRTVGSVAATDGRVIVAYDEPTLVRPPAAGLPPGGWNPKSDPPVHRGEIVMPVRRVRVGIADTPIRPHAWLDGAWLAPYPRPLPAHFFAGKGFRGRNYRAGHATAVTGVVLDRAPQADVQVHAILDDEGKASSWEVATGLVEFAGSGIDILNLSFACYTLDGQPPLCLSAAVQRLQPETLIVAAAGNYGNLGVVVTEAGEIDMSTAPAWPAALPSVVAVGSCNEKGGRSAFSPEAPWVSVHSIGEKVTSLLVRDLLADADTDEEFAHWDGTSFSAARVTGAIAAKVQPASVSAANVWNAMQETMAASKAWIVD